MKTTGVSEYMFDLIPETSHIYNIFHQILLQHFIAELIYSYSFFPYTLLEWDKLDKTIQQFKTIKSFRNSLLTIDLATPKPVDNIHNPTG